MTTSLRDVGRLLRQTVERRRGLTRVLVVALGVSVAVPGLGVHPASAAFFTPPSAGLNILAFPQRDFLSSSGYLASDTVRVSVIHPNGVSYTTDDITPQADPKAAAGAPFAGIVDVNHPGAACWPTTTPDIRPEDKVRITIVANPSVPSRVGEIDETTVRNVTAGRPVQTAADTVQVHGTAAMADGVTPIPVGQLEQRMVANRDAFLRNGRRTLRATAAAGSDGALSYDTADNPTGLAWTATYTGLTAADVTRALGAESRVLWLPPVVAPAVPTEGTIYENGAGVVAGPAGPACTAPLEKLAPPPGTETTPPSDPTALTATVSNGNTVALTWTASSDNVGVVDYGVYRDGVPIATVQNPGASAPAPTSFTDSNVPSGTYTYTVDAGDAVGNRSGSSNAATVTTVRPVATLPAGTVVHEPPVAPVQIISFPARDFLSSSGFLASDQVEVQILRKVGGSLVLVSSTTEIPQADPRAGAGDPFAGIVEVNHPGGACWVGSTPDIRAGDVIREIAFGPDGSIRTVEQTTTSNVVATRPVVVKPATGTAADGVVAIHGVALDVNGDPLPVDQVEQRLVANRDAFDLTARRTIRAGGAGKDGTFSYDTTDNPTGVQWTATYTGLTADDVARAVGGTSPTSGRVFTGAESRVLWLSATPVAAPEITIYENDGGTNVLNGPAAPVCTAPSEPLDTAAPTFPTSTAGLTAATQPGAAANTTDVGLTWTAASDDVAVFGYRVYRDGKAVRNVGATTTSYLDKDVVGTHTYSIDATDAASPGVGGNAQGSPYGNRSAQCDQVTVTVSDISPPTVPTSLAAKTGLTGTDVTLTWTASTDNTAVTGYGVYRRVAGDPTWAKIGSDVTSGTSFTDPSVPPGSYEYTVDAADAAGNRSAKVDPPATVNATADLTAPSDVTGLTASNAPDIHGRDVSVSWSAATDNVGVTGYGVYRDGVKIADVNVPALSYLDAARPAGTYRYTVDAVDSAGNRSMNRPTPVAVVVANDPPVAPHSLIAFPARDFISATGYLPNTAYTFSVIRGATVFTSTAFTSDATGLVEVNHPGGGCWTGTTPDLRAGDVVRITDASGLAEQTTVANVTADRPVVTSVDPATGGGTVLVRGTARDAGGKPLPLDQVENRLVANRDAFDLTGRRTVRAGGAGLDGTLTYDATGSVKWTAKYVFQTPNDLARAVGGTSTSGTSFVGAESRALWLGRSPAAFTETTIFENGAGVTGGPAAGIAGCTSGPAETPAPGAAVSAAPLFEATAVGGTSVSQAVTLTNNGTGALRVDHAYLAGLNPGDFVITANPANGARVAVGASVTVSVAFKPLASGQRQANLSFSDDAANTTDQTVALVGGTPVVTGPPTATAPQQSLAAGRTLGLDTNLGSSTIPVDLRWTGTGSRSELQMASGSSTSTLGSYTPVTLTPDTATSTTVNLRMGTSAAPVAYQFQVRSCNSTSCGAWTAGAKLTLAPTDDAQLPATAYKGTWSTSLVPGGAYAGTIHWSTTSAQAVLLNGTSFSLSGNAAWVSTMGPDRGLAQVQVDGGTAQVVDLYATILQPARIVWARDGLAVGSHTVTVTALGKKNAASSGTRVDVDMTAVIR